MHFLIKASIFQTGFFLPIISDMINKTIKMKNKTFAIEAAPAATPPKPNIAAIIANTMKIIVHFNIIKIFKLILI